MYVVDGLYIVVVATISSVDRTFKEPRWKSRACSWVRPLSVMSILTLSISRTDGSFGFDRIYSVSKWKFAFNAVLFESMVIWTTLIILPANIEKRRRHFKEPHPLDMKTSYAERQNLTLPSWTNCPCNQVSSLLKRVCDCNLRGPSHRGSQRTSSPSVEFEVILWWGLSAYGFLRRSFFFSFLVFFLAFSL